MIEYLQDKILIVQPPYWNGTIRLHCIPNTSKSKFANTEWGIRQALVDSGLFNAEDVEFSPPVELTLGYPMKERA